MKSIFYIVLNMKTAGGFESFGRFFIGNDSDFAYELFSKLKGSQATGEEDILHMDLMETKDDLPVNIRVIDCTLNEITENCRIITKEVFRRLNLK